jgi:uncharacterized protein (DUF2336 family)
MVEYHQFVELSQSGNSEERGQAAHLAAMAYVTHDGPADEQAALYAALIGFLDDPSVKVRAALAYGLLHSRHAPRPVLLALLQDSAIIARAVVQYSPALLDVDIVGLVPGADLEMLCAIAMRTTISARLADALVQVRDRGVILKLLARQDAPLDANILGRLAQDFGEEDAEIRGALLRRKDLPPVSRLRLVEAVAAALKGSRIVQGAVAARRLQRIMRNSADMALTAIGEREAAHAEPHYASSLIADDKISTRVMLHAIINGHVLFFADCVAELSGASRQKVFTLLEGGSRGALNALLARCGLSEAVRNLIARLIFHARTADLADDVAARHFVVTALTEELIVDHDGAIPLELEEAFAYLSEQNVLLARSAARGVMSTFAGDEAGSRTMVEIPMDDRLALPAA